MFPAFPASSLEHLQHAKIDGEGLGFLTKWSVAQTAWF